MDPNLTHIALLSMLVFGMTHPALTPLAHGQVEVKSDFRNVVIDGSGNIPIWQGNGITFSAGGSLGLPVVGDGGVHVGRSRMGTPLGSSLRLPSSTFTVGHDLISEIQSDPDLLEILLQAGVDFAMAPVIEPAYKAAFLYDDADGDGSLYATGDGVLTISWKKSDGTFAMTQVYEIAVAGRANIVNRQFIGASGSNSGFISFLAGGHVENPGEVDGKGGPFLVRSKMGHAVASAFPPAGNPAPSTPGLVVGNDLLADILSDPEMLSFLMEQGVDLSMEPELSPDGLGTYLPGNPPTIVIQGEGVLTVGWKDSEGIVRVVQGFEVVAPTLARCRNLVLDLDASGNASITPEDLNDGSVGAGGILDMVLDCSVFDCRDLGMQEVTLTVFGEFGDQSSCTATVEVRDVSPPVVVCRDIEIELGFDGPVVITPEDVDGGSFDNCGILSLTLDRDTFDCSTMWRQKVSLTATDHSGNTASGFAYVWVYLPEWLLTQDFSTDSWQSDFELGPNPTGATVDFDQAFSVEPETDLADKRVYLATKLSDFTSGSFIYKADVTIENSDPWETPFFGLGNPMPGDHYYEPSGPSVLLAIHAFQRRLALRDTIDEFVLGSHIPVPNDLVGTHGVLMRYHHESGRASFLFDYLNDGNFEFLFAVSAADNGFTSENSQLILGGGKGVSFDNVEIIRGELPSNQMTAQCKDFVLPLENNGQALLSPEDIDDGSVAICGIERFELSQSQFDCSHLGEQWVEMTVFDQQGEYATCMSTVTIVDQIAPVALAKDLVVELDENGVVTITPDMIDNGSHDNCGIVNRHVFPSVFHQSDAGPNEVVYTVTDQSGNSATAVAIVTVDAAPIAAPDRFVILEDTILEQVNVFENNGFGPDFLGNQPTTITSVSGGESHGFSLSPQGDFRFEPSLNAFGVFHLTYTITDADGDMSTATIEIEVQPVNDPPIARCQDLVVTTDPDQCSASVLAETFDTGSGDPDDGVLSYTITPPGPYPVGETMVTLTVSDPSGLSDQCTANLVVTDLEPPQVVTRAIGVSLDESGYASITVNDVDGGSSDNCEIVSMHLDVNEFGCADLGGQVVTLTAMDASGNQSSATIVVQVSDVTAPHIQCPETIEVDAQSPSGAVVEFTVVAADACDPAPLIQTSVPSGFLFPVGTTEVSGIATDAAGNENLCSFLVIVRSPEEMANQLVETIESMESISGGTANSLVSKLDSITAAIEGGDAKTATNQIKAFVNQINAQTGKKLTQEQAEALIHAAESLESSLNNPIEPNSVRLGGLLKVRRMEGSDVIELRWPGGSLQSSESPTGPWENVSIDANVLRIPVSQSRRFYRVTETKTVR